MDGPSPGLATTAPGAHHPGLRGYAIASDVRDEEQAYVAALTQHCPEAELARGLARRFLTLVREREHATLAPWVEQVEQSDVPELRGFAAGLRRDWAAVSAGLELPWSNGQTEGQRNQSVRPGARPGRE